MSSLSALSDQLFTWSVWHARQTTCNPTSPPQDPAASTPVLRACSAWLPHRALQTLRQARVQVCRRPGPWTQALSVGQPFRRASADGLRSAGPSRTGGRVSLQLPTHSRHPRRVVRHQLRTAAPARDLLNASDEQSPASRPLRHPRRQPSHRQHAPGLSRWGARRRRGAGGMR